MKKMRKVSEMWSDDPRVDDYKRDANGVFLRDENGKKIPVSFMDDIEDLKVKMKSLGKKAKDAIANFLFGSDYDTQVAVAECGDNVLTGDENWIPQSREELCEKAKELRKSLETAVEYVAAFQIYCAEHTRDRDILRFTNALNDDIQNAIDMVDGMSGMCCSGGECDCGDGECTCTGDDGECDCVCGDGECDCGDAIEIIPVDGGEAEDTVELTNLPAKVDDCPIIVTI